MSIKQIISDWENFLKSGGLPFFEHKISNGVDTIILSIELEIIKHSMAFYFDVLGENSLHLDGLTHIARKGGNGTVYAKVALKHFNSLNDVLEHINADITSYIYDNGFLVV